MLLESVHAPDLVDPRDPRDFTTELRTVYRLYGMRPY